MAALALALVAAGALAAAPTACGLEYLGYYGVNVSAQADWLSLGVGAASAVDAYYTASGGRIKGMVRMPETGIYDRAARTLAHSWKSGLSDFVGAQVAPRMANGSAIGVFLGDELCCHDVSCWHRVLDPLSAQLRALLGPKALLYENECGDSIVGLDKIAPDLDWVSVDIYKGYSPADSNGTAEAAAVRAFVEKELYPRMAPHQRVFAVPGTFGCSNTSYMPLAASATSVIEKLDAYWAWGREDPRLAGLNPWHFNFRGHPQHGPPCDMQLGAADLPGVVDKLREIGQWIIHNNTAQR